MNFFKHDESCARCRWYLPRRSFAIGIYDGGCVKYAPRGEVAQTNHETFCGDFEELPEGNCLYCRRQGCKIYQDWLKKYNRGRWFHVEEHDNYYELVGKHEGG